MRILIRVLWMFFIFNPVIYSASAQSSLPNIIFVLTDDQTYESLARMPFVGTRDWIKFTNAYVNVALCCPSRATILSGKYSHKSGVETNNLGYLHDDMNDIAARLRQAGYSNAYYGKYLNNYPFGRQAFVPP